MARSVEQLAAASAARELVPQPPTLELVAQGLRRCRACPLYEHASQAVPGEGPADADVVLVGEQPGDSEDRQGRPFVGPAGGLLDRALEAAAIDRERVFVTNAVKHFKWAAERGGRRIHQPPNAREIGACRPWLAAELEALAPRLVVALGSTAARTLIGSGVKVTRQRGELLPGALAPRVAVTVHPSSILRADEPERQQAFEAFVADLASAAAAALESG